MLTRRSLRPFILGAAAPLLLLVPAFVQVIHGAGNIVVTTTADNTAGSLRSAIQQANDTAGPCIAGGCTITFTAGGTYVVTASSGALPAITMPNVVIDGTVPGSSPNTQTIGQPDNAQVRVAIVSSGGFSIDGLTFSATGDGVRYVALGGFNRAIVITSSLATVAGNFIGTDTSGAVARTNTTGVEITGTFGGGATNTIGGGLDADRNVISGNTTGINLLLNAASNQISGNYIGPAATTLAPLAGQATGVRVDPTAGIGNQIQQNLFIGNGIGIDLGLPGSTPNDPGDADVGGNGIQNFPTVNQAGLSGNTLLLDLSIDSSAAVPTPHTFLMEVYKADAAGEGIEYLGASCMGTLSGAFTGQVIGVPKGSVVLGDKVVVTASSYTDYNCTISGDGTSEFSSPPATVILQPGVVINTNNSGFGSLRQAILDADSGVCPTPCYIDFAIPLTDPGFVGGVFTIKPTSPLPQINASIVHIRGETQTMFTGDTNPSGPEIVINGSLAGPTDGIVYQASTSGSQISSIVINGFNGNGLVLSANSTSPSTDYVFSSYFGVDATATTAVPNTLSGILLTSSSRAQIGTPQGRGNVISGNGLDGISIDAASTQNLVYGNFIGTNQTRTASIPNGRNGVTVEGTFNHIGDPAQRFLGSTPPSKKGGKPTPKTDGLPQSGVDAGNVIANNVGAGVVVGATNPAATGNSIRVNYIFNNGQLGIDLGGDGVTPNDPLDPDTGANDLQNFPVITSASETTGVTGTLNSTPSTSFDIDIFTNTVADPSGFGEGKTAIGIQTVTTDAAGNATFSLAVTAPTILNGQFITATATDRGTNSTSEFSKAVLVGGVVVPPSADLVIKKRGPASMPASGDISFTITVTNLGPADAVAVTVNDPTPAGLIFVSSSCGPFPCSLGTITAGTSQVITADYSPTNRSAPVTNSANVTSRTPDPNTSNNTAVARVGNGCPTAPPSQITPMAGAIDVQRDGNYTWTNVGATSYDLYYGPVTSGGCSILMASGIVGTQQSYTGLEPGVEYESRIVANRAGCPSLSSVCTRFTVCGPPNAPRAGVHGAPTSGRTYFVIWAPVLGFVDHYVVERDTTDQFLNPQKFPTTNTSMDFTDLAVNAPLVLFYRVQAVGGCANAGSPYSKPVRVVVLPPKNAIINVPAGSVEPVTVQVFVPGDPGPVVGFVASLDKPWLIKVSPSKGALPPEGLTFDVTIDPSQLPNGTFTATLTLQLLSGPPPAKAIVTSSSSSKAVPVTINLVTPVFPIDPNAPTPETLIVPAVGHLIGFNSQWRSDLRVFNNSGDKQSYQLDFIMSKATDSKQTTIESNPGETTALDDIIHNWFGFGEVGDSALGILEIRPVNSSASTNPLATIVSSRTFDVSNSQGTVGQFIPGIAFKNFIGQADNSILSLQQIAQSTSYRTNFGVVEAGGSAANVLLSIFNSAGAKLVDVPVDLNPNEQKTLNGLLAQQGITLSDGRVEARVTGGDGKVTAYASVLDNISQDPLLVPPTILGSTTSQSYVLPGVANINNGLASWRTDMRVFNAGATSQTVNLVFYPESNSGAPLSATLTVNPREVKVLDDVLASLFTATNVGGAVHVNTVTDSQLVITGRTFNQTSGGTLGQFIPAATPTDGISAGGRALNILQVEDSPRFRTNVGFAEMSGKPATVEVSVVLPDSKVTPTIEYSLAPNEFLQVPIAVFGAGNLYNTRVSVRVTQGGGTVTAYGSVIDQITTDPTYIKAQ